MAMALPKPKSVLDGLPAEEIARQYNAGEKTMTELARDHGVRRNSLQQALRNRGLIDRKLVSDEAFIEAWNASASVDEAAGRAGLARATTMKRARQLRTAGVPLKRFEPPRRQKRVSDEVFIAAWDAATGVAEAAAALEMSPSGARCRAMRLRKAGHALKHMPKASAKRGKGRASKRPSTPPRANGRRRDRAWVAAWMAAADSFTDATPFIPPPPGDERVNCPACWDTGLCAECLGRASHLCPAGCDGGTCRCATGAELARERRESATPRSETIPRPAGAASRGQELTRPAVEAASRLHHAYSAPLILIAEAVGVSYQGLQKAAARYELPAFRAQADARQQDRRIIGRPERRLMQALDRLGVTAAEIAEIADRAEVTVRQILAEEGATAAVVAPPPQERRRLSDDEFVAAWLAAAHVEDVQEATGLARMAAINRASRLRRRGHDLPSRTRREDRRRRGR